MFLVIFVVQEITSVSASGLCVATGIGVRSNPYAQSLIPMPLEIRLSASARTMRLGEPLDAAGNRGLRELITEAQVLDR